MLFLGSVLFRKNNRGLLSKETTKLAESMMWTVHSIHLPRNGYNKIFLCFKSWNHEIIWISHETLFGGYVCPLTEFQNLLFRVLRREPLSVLYYCICAFLCHCCSFNPSLCHFSSFLLSYVAVSRPSCLSKFCSNRASVMWSSISIDSGKLPPTPLLTQLTQHFALSERLVLALGQGRGGWPSQHL